jgi:hypothetical protein
VTAIDWETQLMGQHAYLSAMVGVVHNHVNEHRSAWWPVPTPTVALEVVDRSPWRERCPQHFRTIPSTAGERNLHLPARTTPWIELCGQLDLGSRKPQPLSAGMMHMSKYRRDGTAVAASRLCRPCPRIQPIKNHLDHALADDVGLKQRLAEVRGWQNWGADHKDLLDVVGASRVLRELGLKREGLAFPQLYILKGL